MTDLARPKPGTQKARLLAALEAAQHVGDGWLHDTYSLRMIVHSRVSDLRGMGYNVEHSVIDGEHVYRLKPSAPEGPNGQLRIA